jgi:COMM domain containing 10
MIFERILSAVGDKGTDPFSTDEVEKLAGMLGCAAGGITTLCEGGSYVFERAAYHGVNGEALTEHLVTVGMLEDRAAVLGTVWQDGGKQVVDAFRGTSNGAARVLNSTNWSVHVNVASNATAAGRDVYGVVELGLSDPANPDKPSKPILTEFSHDELYDFFQKLETIQEQLDELA